MEPLRHVTPDIDILPSYVPAPGLGQLPVNAFLIKAHEPVLVDAGLNADRDAFMQALEHVIDPEDVRWLWLTHPDQDHVGALQEMLRRSPDMKVITSYFGLGIYSLFGEIPMDRVYFLNPGERVDLGDRTLTAIRPPTFDNPATTGLFDSRSRALFTSDCFGGLLEAPAGNADDLAAGALRRGQVLWTTMDTPWIHKVDEARFAAELDSIRAMEPAIVLSAHLPPAHSMTETLLGALVEASKAEPFVGPNQAALEAMLAGIGATPAAAV